MGEIAGLPYWEVAFDDNGRPNAGDADTLISGAPGLGVTDLMVFAHGWNNDRGQATSLYRRFFEQVPGLLTGGGPGLGFAGVIWPAKRWADETIPGSAGGAAALADAVGPPADRALVEDLTRRRCSPASPAPCRPRPARAAPPGSAARSRACGTAPRRRCGSSPISR